MAPKKPTLHPLTTPKTMNFPSELRERTYTATLDPMRPHEGKDIKKEGDAIVIDDDNDAEITITPPPAYTEFLNTFSPIFASPASSRANFSKYMHEKPRRSPTSPPSSTTATTFSSGNNNAAYASSSKASTGHGGLPTPTAPWSKSPDHARRMRLPPPYVITPVTDSPRSAHPIRSPYTPSELRMQHFDSPVSDNGNYFSIRHVVTTTITYKRAPQLDPPPQGKRRRNADERRA